MGMIWNEKKRQQKEAEELQRKEDLKRLKEMLLSISPDFDLAYTLLKERVQELYWFVDGLELVEDGEFLIDQATNETIKEPINGMYELIACEGYTFRILERDPEEIED